MDDDLDVVFQKGVENDQSPQESSNRKRSIADQAETGSASKKARLSQTESDIIELWDAEGQTVDGGNNQYLKEISYVCLVIWRNLF